jgi:hypothetical protein
MRSEKLLACLLAAGSALSVVPALTGCAGEASYVVETEVTPPPPRREVTVYRPGYVWIEGHWVRRGHDWRWRPGYYERERHDMVYVNGHWERRGRAYVWIEGRWRPRASVTIEGRL